MLKMLSSVPLELKGQKINTNFSYGRLGTGGLLLAVYLGTSPIYWFWSIPLQVLSMTKAILSVLAIVIIWLPIFRNRRLRLPKGLCGATGMLLLFLSMTVGFFQSDFEIIIIQTSNIVMGFVMLWTTYYYSKFGGNIIKVFSIAFTILLPFCALVISARFLGFPNWESPFLGFPFTLADTGFGGVRTGWSLGVTLFLPFVLMYAEITGLKHKSTIRWAVYVAILIILIIGSQLAVGGRSGLVGSLVVIGFWIVVGKKMRWLWVMPILLIVFFILDLDWLFEHLRFDRLGGVQNFEDLDHFSASRVGLNKTALNLILNRPLFGYGFGPIHISGISRAEVIHNLWLKMGVQAGILTPLIFGIIVVEFGRKALIFNLKICSKDSINSASWAFSMALISTLGAGVILSMFEPNALLGTFQPSAMWWAAAGAGIGLSDKSFSQIKGPQCRI